jgi:hypothetical protein
VEDDEDPQDNEEAASDEDSTDKEEGGERPAAVQQEDTAKQEAQQWINSLVDKDVDIDAEFKAEAKSIDVETLSWMVAMLKRKDYKLMTSKAALKFIGKDFLVHEKERRLFEPLTVAELKREADKRGIRTNVMKKDALVSELIKPDNETAIGNRRT